MFNKQSLVKQRPLKMATQTSKSMTPAMNALLDSLSDDLQSYLSKVSVLSGLQISQLAGVWCSTVSSAPAVLLAPGATVNAPAKRGRKADPDGPKCDYVFQKGKTPGKFCGDPVCTDSTTKCRKHLKFEGTAPVAAGKTSVLSAAKDFASGVAKPSSTSAPVARSTKLSISRNAYGNYEHKATNLVFNENKIVYGKQVADKVLPLSSADVEKCKSHSFKWLPEAVAQAESTDPEEDEEELVALAQACEDGEEYEEEEVEEEEVEEEEVEEEEDEEQ